MAMNPMQRKARNSFLLGMLSMFVIAAIIIGILVVVILNMRKAEQQNQAASKTVYLLTRDILSGEVIATNDVRKVSLQTNIVNDQIATPDDLTVIMDDGETEEIIAQTAKIDIPKGAILTKTMLTPSEERVTDDLRVQEYNMISLPSNLVKEDYIDIRLMLPNGQDYIVVAKKRVLKASSTTVYLKMTESEIVTMSNAIVEAYKINGALLYAVKYDTPGIQNSATANYVVSDEVVSLISKNPNIVNDAKNAIITRFNNNGDLRTNIRNALPEEEEGKESVDSKVQEQVQKQQTERNKYLDTLSSGSSK